MNKTTKKRKNLPIGRLASHSLDQFIVLPARRASPPRRANNHEAYKYEAHEARHGYHGKEAVKLERVERAHRHYRWHRCQRLRLMVCTHVRRHWPLQLFTRRGIHNTPSDGVADRE